MSHSDICRRPSLVLIVALALFVIAVSACNGGTDAPGTATPTTSPRPSLTATGRILFITTEGDLASMDPNGGDRKQITEEGGVSGFEQSPDGSMIALEIADAVRVIDPAGEQLFEISAAADPLWSPTLNRLAMTSGTGLLIAGDSGETVLELPDSVRPAWAPDGERLAYVRLEAGKGTPAIVEVSSGNQAPLAAEIEPHDPVYPIAWHPAGNTIAYRDALFEPATSTKVALPGVPVNFSPDGRMLMVVIGPDPSTIGTPARLLDMTQGGTPVIGLDVRPALDGEPPWLFILRWTDWSPDGRLLFYADPEGFRPRVRIYDTIEITQDSYRGIRGENPELSADSTHATFMYENKVWVLANDGSALLDNGPGLAPSWQVTPSE